DGTAYEGYAGDTLASALLANGVHLVARSFKYHRPRGILCSGSDEPNALVQLARGARTEPNVRATTQELFEGLIAASQNRWPSLGFDVGAINNALSRLLPAGFYYKTFMWPPTPRWWLRYEHLIRHAAGMGRCATVPDPDRYEHQYTHCDVLVIGGGPADHQHVAVRVLMLIAVRIRYGGTTAHSRGVPNKVFVAQPPARRRRPHERLVVEAGRQQPRQCVVDRSDVE